MRNPTLLIFLTCILLMNCKTNSKKELDYPIMGNLLVGEYQVGYKTLFRYDKSRNGVPYSDWDGKLYPAKNPEKGRQFQINIWYPSKVGSGSAIKYNHYINLMGRQTDFDDTEILKEFSKQMFIDRTNALGAIKGVSNFNEEDFNKLKELDVIAHLDAKPIDESFPVLFFSNGSSPAFQSIMCEYLASQGYVVVAFAEKGRFSSGLEASTIGLETAVDDMEFVMSKISELPYVDMNRFGLIGNAITSSICVALASRNEKVKALVSLDGGFPSAFEQRLLKESVFYQPENIKTPILFIYAPHPSIDPKYTYHLKYSNRYYAHFPEMSEFVFLNFGIFNSFVPDIIGKHKGDAQEGYEVASDLVLTFLNGHFKKNEIPFEEEFKKVSSQSIDTAFALNGLKPAPSIAELKDLFIRKGFRSIDSCYQELKKSGNNQPFSESFYGSYRDWLAWKKDPTYITRQKLYELAYDSYPESSMVNYYLASYLKRTGNSKQAVKYYKQVITLIKKDIDKSLTKNVGESLVNASMKAINDIKIK